MSRATFGAELLHRRVLDGTGAQLGAVIDLVLEVEEGRVAALLVELDEGLDPIRLPWPTEERWARVPIEDVGRVDAAVHLAR